VIGILVANAAPIAEALGVAGAPKPTFCLVWAYVGIMTGDAVGGLTSQLLKSRKRPMYAFLLLGLMAPLWFLTTVGISVTEAYLHYLLMGFASGYWILMLTSATEQFGTNIRSTVTTTIPNFIRASVVPMNAAFLALRDSFQMINAAIIVGIVTSCLALVSLFFLKETFSQDLDFVER